MGKGFGMIGLALWLISCVVVLGFAFIILGILAAIVTYTYNEIETEWETFKKNWRGE